MQHILTEEEYKNLIEESKQFKHIQEYVSRCIKQKSLYAKDSKGRDIFHIGYEASLNIDMRELLRKLGIIINADRVTLQFEIKQ
jgi:hypothetical protein